MSRTVALAAYGLTHEYQGCKVLDEVSFELRAGEVLSLIGPNGAGKSTLLRLVAGILDAQVGSAGSPGQLKYLGQDFLTLAPTERAQRVLYLSSDFLAEFALTVRDAVLLGCLPRAAHSGFWSVWTAADYRRVDDAMKRAGCFELANRQLQTLSGGEAQLVTMARALAVGARVLLLDETFNRMDLHHAARMMKLIQELKTEGYAFVFVSHDLNQALSLGDRCLILKFGRVLRSGPTSEAVTEQSMRELYPDVRLRIELDPLTHKPWVRL